MSLSELQAELREFAEARDWLSSHTPQNLSTALMVAAAALADIFQWKTPLESVEAHRDLPTRERIDQACADVLLYLLQVARHCEVDLEQAARERLVRHALKYPAKRPVTKAPRVQPTTQGTHVLLDYENVQPDDAGLRALVPKAGRVWVFHGPHQREVEKRFTSFGPDVTAVPISKTGKNALDFHLSFYMGYIASRSPTSKMVVVANDKGYEPMLQHAKALGFEVRRQSYGGPVAAAAKRAKAAASAAPAAKPPAVKKRAAAKTVASKAAPIAAAAALVPAPAPAPRPAKTPKASALKKAGAPAAGKSPAAKKKPPATQTLASKKAAAPAETALVKPAAVTAAKASTAAIPSLAPAAMRRVVDSLRKVGISRPTKAAALRRLLKSLLGVDTTDDSIEVALHQLMATGVVGMGAGSTVSYPGFEADTAAAAPSVASAAPAAAARTD